MKIDRKLNLVVPVYDDEGDKTYYVHAMPLSREVFEQHFKLLAKTFNALYAQGLGIAGPRVAALTLKSVAKEDGDGTGAALLAEMHRLANVLVPKGSGGYEMVPWEEALAKNFFSEDDAAEVENALTFFIVASCMHKKREMPGVMDVLNGNWGADTSPLPPMEYASSLRTSTATATTGESVPQRATPLSIPS